MRGLTGKVAIVTGAAGGMGGGITTRFVEEGVTVVCLDIVDPAGRVGELNHLRPGAAIGVVADVRDPAAVDACVADTVERFGRLDVMVNNAGIEQPALPLDETPDELFREVIDTDLYGVFVGIRAAARVMRRQNAGAIISTSSQIGKVAFESWGIYAAAKAGVISLTQAAARELVRHNVRVNAICPGSFDTPMATRIFTATAEAIGAQPADVLADYPRQQIGLGRFGRPDEMGAMCAYLASDDASFVTGTALNLTGGEQYFF
jgi:NAD(P)-dependent dehydrogenase (short-subunit alcohol dehydrogenase family)